MPEKNLATWDLISVLVALGASLGGGFIRYREDMKMTKRFQLVDFLLDMFTSAFVGFMAFWVCQDVLVQPEALCACAAGFAGNMGANVFQIGRQAFRERVLGGNKGEQP
ncbi:phage holin family protein [Sutterella wadsworthensis]|uniref:phage holin family protein n=1 Tax=Sutterella wadsworthensis TaxID=40545 RepID=UPI003AF14AF4